MWAELGGLRLGFAMDTRQAAGGLNQRRAIGGIVATLEPSFAPGWPIDPKLGPSEAAVLIDAVVTGAVQLHSSVITFELRNIFEITSTGVEAHFTSSNHT